MDISGGSTQCEFATRDGCFDIAWSEKSDQLIAAATGDGSVKIFSLTNPGERPISVLTGHTAETYSVDWNIYMKESVLTASWDRTVRVWDISTAAVGGRILCQHNGIAYEAKWNPRVGKIFASVGGDGVVQITDVVAGRGVGRIQAHANEILAVDWNKYREFQLATGSVDKQIKIWDMRRPDQAVHVLEGYHDLAVRRLKFSPHSESILASCSYDMTVKVWSIDDGSRLVQNIATYDHHEEFVIGIDFSNFYRDYLASTGWDRKVALWTIGSQPLQRGPLQGLGQVPKHLRLIRQSAA